MADPHNKTRYGETWDSSSINSYLWELESLKSHVIFSGGWAWHFMSPIGHKELKHAHDHKDVDIFVTPEDVPLVIGLLSQQGFKKVPTRFDGLPNNADFRRYVKVTKDSCKLIIDFFVRKDLQVREVQGQGIKGLCMWRVVDPKQLITFYKTIHSSDNCFAVKAASSLLDQGIDPVGSENLVRIPEEGL
jgi:hypothetical protein